MTLLPGHFHRACPYCNVSGPILPHFCGPEGYCPIHYVLVIAASKNTMTLEAVLGSRNNACRKYLQDIIMAYIAQDNVKYGPKRKRGAIGMIHLTALWQDALPACSIQQERPQQRLGAAGPELCMMMMLMLSCCCSMPSMKYGPHGGPGYLISVGLLKKVSYSYMQKCLASGEALFSAWQSCTFFVSKE